MITLHVVIMVPAVMSGLANVMKDSTVTIAQVNYITCNWWFADQNLSIKYKIFLESCKLIFLVFNII